MRTVLETTDKIEFEGSVKNEVAFRKVVARQVDVRTAHKKWSKKRIGRRLIRNNARG